MPQNQHQQDRMIIVQSQNNPRSIPAHCGHEDETTNHMHTTVNSYAPVRCLRMGAFCIVLCENFSPVMVADLTFSAFLRRKGEKHYSEPMGTKGGEKNERRQ